MILSGLRATATNTNLLTRRSVPYWQYYQDITVRIYHVKLTGQWCPQQLKEVLSHRDVPRIFGGGGGGGGGAEIRQRS